MFGQQLAGGAANASNGSGNMAGKQGDIGGEKQQSQEKESHEGMQQQNGAGGMEDQQVQDPAGIGNQATSALQKQPQDEKNEGKKGKDLKAQSQSDWTD